jgi:hypothetical protein
LWRRDALLDLIDSGLVDSGSWAEFDRFEPVYALDRGPVPARPATVLISRNGSHKVGGGGHFLASMADHYQTLGHQPIIVGTYPEFVGQTGIADGVPFAFIEGTAAALRRFFLSNDIRFVHVMSGLGFAVAEALNYSNIPFVYGVHYWREVLGTSDSGPFFEPDGSPIVRPEFHWILTSAATVYANSEFTREKLEKAYGVRCPVVFSLPRDLAQETAL